jgi:hypothetical protein
MPGPSKKRTRRKNKPATVHDMAYRRGMAIHKAKRGGWFVTLMNAPWGAVMYASHDFAVIETFIKRQPILIRRNGA